MTKAIVATDVPPRIKKTNYPEVFAKRVEGRTKRVLGDLFQLTNFGVNLTTLMPGAQSSLMHKHSQQDEFIFILQGTATLATESGEQQLEAGMCAGFPKQGEAHVLKNTSAEPVTYLEIGDRSKDDYVSYPQDDLAANIGPDGQWVFTHKDGTPYTK